MPAGRPTDYDPEICETIIVRMAEGYSLTAVCGEMGIWRQRVYEWAEKHQQLADAVKVGQAKRTFKLETDLLAAKDGPSVTSRIFALKNSAPDEWRDKQEVDHSSSDGTMSPKDTSEAVIAALAAKHAPKPD